MADGPKKKGGKKSAPPEFASDGKRHTPKSHDPKGDEITKTTGKPRRSTTGARKPKVNQSNWRRKIQQSRIKFDDVAKAIFLTAFRQNNLKMRACDVAGVALCTVREHLKNDPDFAAAYDQAVEEWRDFVVDKAIVKIALEGTLRQRFKEGEVVEEWMDHPVPLLLAELKRVDHGFREKATLDVHTGGGVLIAPPYITPSDWMDLQRLENESRTNPMLQIEGPSAETLDAIKKPIPQTEQVIRG